VTLGAMVLAALIVRRGDVGQSSASKREAIPLDRLFGCGAYIIGLALVLLEVFAWGRLHGWRDATISSALAMWTALFAGGIVMWVAWSRTRSLDGVVGAVFCLLGVFLLYPGVAPFDRGFASRAVSIDAALLDLWLFNPRGLAFLSAIVSASLGAWVYRGLENASGQKRRLLGDASEGRLAPSQVLGISAYLAGLALITVELFAQGTSRDWQTTTSLAITLGWTVYATATLLVGIVYRSGSVRMLSLALFVLTVAKVFLFDIWHLQTVIRVFAFLSLGVALLLVSFLYRHYRERIREWIAPAA
jgi:uncharacterized membrane protein